MIDELGWGEEELRPLEEALQYRFENKRLLKQALIHRSLATSSLMPVELVPLVCNERLEFLGDSLIGANAATLLFINHKTATEGLLTTGMANVVSTAALLPIAIELGLPSFLRVSSDEYGAKARSNKAFVDCLEAVVGAVYVDSKGSSNITDHLVRSLLKPLVRKPLTANKSNYKAMLQEHFAKRGRLTVPHYTTEWEGPDHNRTYECVVSMDDVKLGKGSGTTKKGAEIDAARSAVESLGLLVDESGSDEERNEDWGGDDEGGMGDDHGGSDDDQAMTGDDGSEGGDGNGGGESRSIFRGHGLDAKGRSRSDVSGTGGPTSMLFAECTSVPPTIRARHFSTTAPQSTADYLASVGFSIEESRQLEDAFVKMGTAPTVESLKGFGIPGLKALLESLHREQASRQHLESAPKVRVVVTFPGGRETTYSVPEGSSLQELVEGDDELKTHMEYACGGIAACSTCHVIVHPEDFDKIEEADEAEMDMIDLAYDACDSSRLGCQVVLTTKADGIRVRIPEGVNNLF